MSGLCPSSGILNARKRFGNLISFRPQVRRKTPAHFGPLERTTLNLWTTTATQASDSRLSRMEITGKYAIKNFGETCTE
jgi:hypothetical protein